MPPREPATVACARQRSVTCATGESVRTYTTTSPLSTRSTLPNPFTTVPWECGIGIKKGLRHVPQPFLKPCPFRLTGRELP